MFGAVRRGAHLVLSLFRTRFVQGDLLASEPKQTELEQG
jgi:hypothetical protein